MHSIRTGVVMDPIAGIAPAKDSTLAMLLEAQARGHELILFELGGLFISNGEAFGRGRPVTVRDDARDWYSLGDIRDTSLTDLDLILMRKDPPFNMEYVYSTYILERAELGGVLVVNRPASLRDINEKAFTAWFPQCCPETLVTRSMNDLRAFRDKHRKIVVKPLDGMGGKSIFVVEHTDNNANVIFETLTDDGARYAMAQRFVPEITAGDKRIILINGEAPAYALARVPGKDDNRGNLVMGAQGEIRELSDRDRWICTQVGPELSRRGVLFAGLDVIGDFLTEVNVTSPTGIREIAKLSGVDLAAGLFDSIEKELSARSAAA
ncbi:MAG: glutathione synthase [Chromatiales bacterium]|jgi:glutathione synthase|nr:glutathione synthase [Chromatiales bacterium]MDP6151281.1 glutathione synthase [Gammaproteobacteria bacterium]MDP7094247.1 glutathione synthase [Gammaproteobacteria bacterium]MDP7270444.1 glutathione synthase [Gammaproteobacteria bacterium]HJP05289.1 glutathione synthase [Gammaproteobacteria bacterium]